jgi:hypothetical protein
MKRISYGVLIALVAGQALAMAQQQLKVAFITRNAYGNNLYFDNLTVGRQLPIDVGLVAITNIAADTSYLAGGGGMTVAPAVSVVNLGSLAIGTPFPVTLSVSPVGYTSTRTVASLARGAMLQIVMDSLAIPSSTPLTFTVTAALPTDDNHSNDTLRQTSLFLPGAQRSVLLEQWTSSTCGPCASNNPTIDAFIAAHAGSVVAVKYHVGWPPPGDDPMYFYNPTQSYDRRSYYGVSSVPHVIMDGVVNPTSPYTTAGSLPDAFAGRRPIGAPISITVHDSLLVGDSVESNVTVTIHSTLRAGSYRLRVQAIERQVSYAVPPGTNGEQDFFEVFRGSYPSSAGTSLPTSPGVHVFLFRYHLAAPAIRDSLTTIAFVQNDFTKEVLNAGTATMPARALPPAPPAIAVPVSREICLAGDALPAIAASIGTNLLTPAGGFHYELFELGFPPSGWRLANPDADITMDRYPGANGPSIGGSASTKMDFYSYGTSGQTDTLFTPAITGLLPTDSLTFDWAYAQYPGYSDQLIVKISTNGGITFDSTIFDKSGALLATAPSTTGEFVPMSSQWKTFRYPLSGLILPAPLAPALVRPADGAAGVPVNPRLVWNRSTGAIRYSLQVSPDSGFSTFLFADSTIVDTSRTLPALATGSTAFWRISAFGIGGMSPWSVIRRFTTVAFLTDTCRVQEGWNLLALPVAVSDARRSILFPSSVSEAYAFSPVSGYVRRDTLLNGVGYWLKFPGTALVQLSGYERLADTVGVVAGWNLIGSLTSPVPAGAVLQSPPGILTSPFYGYAAGYGTVDTLQPAKGYWVKASGNGTIVFGPAAGRK